MPCAPLLREGHGTGGGPFVAFSSHPSLQSLRVKAYHPVARPKRLLNEKVFPITLRGEVPFRRSP